MPSVRLVLILQKIFTVPNEVAMVIFLQVCVWSRGGCLVPGGSAPRGAWSRGGVLSISSFSCRGGLLPGGAWSGGALRQTAILVECVCTF